MLRAPSSGGFDHRPTTPSPGQVVDPAQLAIPEAQKRTFAANREARVAWPEAFPHRVRFFLGRGTRLSPCEARTEQHDGVTVIRVDAAERRRALDRL